MEEENGQVIQETNTPAKNKKGFNITSMVLGIIGVVFCCVWYITIPCSIIAIIFGIAGRKCDGRGMGIAGLILGIVGLGLFFMLIVLGTATLMDSSSSISYYYY